MFVGGVLVAMTRLLFLTLPYTKTMTEQELQGILAYFCKKIKLPKICTADH